MTTANVTYSWHTDIDINGRPYPTRHPVPDHGPNSDDYHGDLTHQQRDHLRAIHEAAHAVAALTAHAHIHYAQITPTTRLITAEPEPSTTGIPAGNVLSCNLTNGQDVAIYLAAGERAEDNWLHHNNLWTPTRAVGIELGAHSDRQHFLDLNPHFGFGIDHNDYRVVHDLADQFVTTHWKAITAVADALASQLYLAGAQIADLAHMSNGTHSSTCIGTPAA